MLVCPILPFLILIWHFQPFFQDWRFQPLPWEQFFDILIAQLFCSEIGTPLGKFLCGGIQALDIEDIGLGSSGFMRAGKELVKETKLHSINIRLKGIFIEL